MPASTSLPWTGIYPIAPTPFDDAGDLDLPGMRRVLDCMIDQGVDGLCILANYSEQFLLTDDERTTLLELCLAHVAGRVPVIVTCSHFSTRIAGDRARAAAAAGAAMLMLMPPYHGTGLRADEAGMLQHFAHVAQVSRLPIMVQDAPLSGVALSVPFLVRLAREVPAVAYFKIEVPFAAAKLRALIEAGGAAIAGPFDGEESITLMADLDAGATGTMCSALLPDLIKPVVDHFLAGRRAAAAAQYARILPLVNYENRQCGLRATKTVMQEGGVIRSDAVRHPLERLAPATRAGLLELARDANPLALRWGR
jgi:dihydrodipicolinate synthase/N-acetylneuraminate lyase